MYYGTRDALFRIVQDEGWRALYAGISPALLGAGAAPISTDIVCFLQLGTQALPCALLTTVCHGPGLSWGIYFTAYNNAKMRWQGLRNEASLSAPLHLLSAAEAGCIVSIPHFE